MAGAGVCRNAMRQVLVRDALSPSCSSLCRRPVRSTPPFTVQQMGKKLAPSQRKAQNLVNKASGGRQKKEDEENEIKNLILKLHPPPRPEPEWMKDPETKKLVLTQRRLFYKSWNRYMMDQELRDRVKKKAMLDTMDQAVAALSAIDNDLGKAADELHEEPWSKEFISGYLPDTPPINGYNHLTRKVDPKLIKPKPTYC